ncbi:MAG: enoyl-CoA hydratase-related protein [Tetrasphaera sp.]
MNTPEFETILLDRPVDGVVVATLNRPDRLNAQTDTMFREFERLARALNDDDDLRVVILTGAGRAFCAGFDLDDAKNLPGLGALGFLHQQERAARGLHALRHIRVPLIAAVNGPAAGGGFSLALAADIRIASPTARFNAAFVKIGLTAGDLGVSWLLPRLVGPARANEIAFTGAQVDAEEAERIGLVNKVVPADQLMSECLAMAELIKANSPGGVQLSKRAIQNNLEVASYAAAIELENRGQALLTRSADMPEALAAFLEKRPANFTGE